MVPSLNISHRLIDSGIFPFNFGRLSTFTSLLFAASKAITNYEKEIDKAVEIASDTPELFAVIEKFQYAFRAKVSNIEAVNQRFHEFTLVRTLDDYLCAMSSARYYASFADNKSILGEMAALWKTVVPNSKASTEQMAIDWEYSPTTSTAIYRNDSRQEMIGFYRIKPFNEAGLNAMLNGELAHRDDLIIEKHYANSFLEATCIFVGYVAGVGRFGSGYVIGEMINQLIPLYNYGQLKVIATRGVTEAGKTLMDRLEFKPLTTSDIHIVNIDSRWIERHNMPKVLSYR